MKNVAIFGDSILRGIKIDSETKKFVFSKTIDWAGIEEQLNVKITNYSKMGSTIKHGFPKLENYLNDSPTADVVVLGYGGNDSDYNWPKVAGEKSRGHTSNTDLDEFERMLGEMIDMVIAKGIKPVLMNLPPIHSTRYFTWVTRNGLNKDNILYFINDDKEVLYRRQEMFSAKIAEIARKRSIELVDIRSKFLAHNDYLDLVCEDGIHLTENGEKVIVESFISHFLVGRVAV